MDNTIKLDEQVTNIIGRYAEDLTVEQLRALPLFAYNMTPHKVAEYLKIPYQTVLTWIRTNEKFRTAISEMKDNTAFYHKEMLNQAATMAWDRIFEYLGQTFEPDDKENRVIQARLATFVISELGIKEIKFVNKEESVVRIEDNSVDILARKIKELDTMQAAPYRISGPTANEDTRYSSMQTADLVDVRDDVHDDEVKEATVYQYAHHPSTIPGQVTTIGNKFVCHICGEKTRDLVVHVRAVHNLSAARYREMYGIDSQAKLYMEIVKDEELLEDEVS